jgi:hypothetical protein
MRRHSTPSETLRAAIILDGRPVRRIARQAQVPPTILTRFVRNENGLSMRTLDRVASVVGLELVSRRRSA